jgi:hypothetical protein
MDYKNYILSVFLEEKNKSNNIFEGFNICYFIDKYKNKPSNICNICLNNCTSPGTPNGYKHIFCFKCIKLWEKIKRTCPVCRKGFLKITHY